MVGKTTNAYQILSGKRLKIIHLEAQVRDKKL
jgi:hypothetical protein